MLLFSTLIKLSHQDNCYLFACNVFLNYIVLHFQISIQSQNIVCFASWFWSSVLKSVKSHTWNDKTVLKLFVENVLRLFSPGPVFVHFSPNMQMFGFSESVLNHYWSVGGNRRFQTESVCEADRAIMWWHWAQCSSFSSVADGLGLQQSSEKRPLY